MSIDDCKNEIYKLVDEITCYDFIVQILTVVRVLHNMWKRDE